jgi:hypothetical protein
VLSFRDFNATDSFLVTLHVKVLDFPNIHRILQQNSLPRGGGEDFEPCRLSRTCHVQISALFVTAKLSRLLSIDSSDSVRAALIIWGQISQTYE